MWKMWKSWVSGWKDAGIFKKIPLWKLWKADGGKKIHIAFSFPTSSFDIPVIPYPNGAIAGRDMVILSFSCYN